MLSHNNEWKTSNDNNNNEWKNETEIENFFFGGFHKQKELLDSDYESKTNKDISCQPATTTTSRRIFWAVWSIFGHVVLHLVSKYYDC